MQGLRQGTPRDLPSLGRTCCPQAVLQARFIGNTAIVALQYTRIKCCAHDTIQLKPAFGASLIRSAPAQSRHSGVWQRDHDYGPLLDHFWWPETRVEIADQQLTGCRIEVKRHGVQTRFTVATSSCHLGRKRRGAVRRHRSKTARTRRPDSCRQNLGHHPA